MNTCVCMWTLMFVRGEDLHLLVGAVGTCMHMLAWVCGHRSVYVTETHARMVGTGVCVCVCQDLCGESEARLTYHCRPFSELSQVELSPCRADKDTECGCRKNQFQSQINGPKHFQCQNCSRCFNGTVKIPCKHHSPKSRPSPLLRSSLPLKQKISISVLAPHEVAFSLHPILWSVALSSCMVPAS